MYSDLLQCFFITLVLTMISISSYVRVSVCQVQQQQYAACSKSFRCANTDNIGYPFWGGDRPEFCGHPSLKLDCQADVPQFAIQYKTYRILGMDMNKQILTVARADLWRTSCTQDFYNTTLNPALFNFVPTDQIVKLYYACTRIDPATANLFNCIVNGANASCLFMLATSDLPIDPEESCRYRIDVRVNQTAAQNLTNLSAALDGGFGLKWDANTTSCKVCMQSSGRCGYNNVSNSFACYCRDGPHNSTCGTSNFRSSTESTSKHHPQPKLAAGVSVGVAGIIICSIGLICYLKRHCLSSDRLVCRKNKGNASDQNVKAFLRDHGSLTPNRYNFSDIKKITNLFKDKLGQGGYGCVYKGILSDGRVVAVKVLSETKGTGDEFINEIASMSQTSHVNIVTLLGFCYTTDIRALIYDFMPNGSLDKYIYNEGSSSKPNRCLGLETLYRIALGIARGLEYLHRGCNTRIVHFDIKPHNILLDEDLCPKISDFGLAKLCKRKGSLISMMNPRGTAGYIAPEVLYGNLEGISHKSDVYSFGMMILEMVGGRKNFQVEESRTSEIYFPHWIYDQMKPGEDLKLQGIRNGEDEETTKKMLLVGLWCIQTNPSDRPSMNKVVDMLEGSLQLIEIPPKPYMFSPPRSAQDPNSSSP